MKRKTFSYGVLLPENFSALEKDLIYPMAAASIFEFLFGWLIPKKKAGRSLEFEFEKEVFNPDGSASRVKSKISYRGNGDKASGNEAHDSDLPPSTEGDQEE